MHLETEIHDSTLALLAAEDWSPAYAKAPKQHHLLIRQTAKLQILTLRYLKGLAKEAPAMVDWFEYAKAVYEQQRHMGIAADGVLAYNINVVINHDAVSAQDQAFIKLVFDTVAATIANGVDSMQVESGRAPIGLSSTSTIIQNLTTQQLANLVGMKVVNKGQANERIVPNPNAAYNIDDTTRSRIAQSIKTSIKLGENREEAVKRLQKVIADPARADMIAYTETVRAYAEGRKTYGYQSGAKYKVWSDSNATDICADNTAQGPIPIGETFVSGDENEPAHPHCLCHVSYLYADTADEAIEQWES